MSWADVDFVKLCLPLPKSISVLNMYKFCFVLFCHSFFLFRHIFYMCACFACMCMYALHVCLMPVEEGTRSPRTVATMLVLGSELRFSSRASALGH